MASLCHIDEGVVSNGHSLPSFSLQVYGYVHLGDPGYIIGDSIIHNIDTCEGFEAWTIKANVLQYYGDSRVDPLDVLESVPYHREVAVILGVDESCVATWVKTCEGVIEPQLVVATVGFFEYWAFGFTLILDDPTLLSDIEEGTLNFEISAFEHYEQHLPQMKLTVTHVHPSVRTEGWEHQGIRWWILESELSED